METALTEPVPTPLALEPAPALQKQESAVSDTSDSKNKKKRKKKKKNRRKSLEGNQTELETMRSVVEAHKAAQGQPEPEQEQDEAEQASEKPQEAAGEEMKDQEAGSQQSKEEDSPASDEDSSDLPGPPSMERTSSLDLLKGTSTRVTSMFSKFTSKVGRKKMTSRTESLAKLEGMVPSPVKSAVKKFEVREDKSLEDLPMRTKRDFFGEGEQSIHVSSEKEKYDALEKQRKSEKEAEDAIKAARQSPPTSKSETKAESVVIEATDAVNSATTESSLTTVDTDDKEQETVDQSPPPSKEQTVETIEAVDTATTESSIADDKEQVVAEQSPPASISASKEQIIESTEAVSSATTESSIATVETEDKEQAVAEQSPSGPSTTSKEETHGEPAVVDTTELISSATMELLTTTEAVDGETEADVNAIEASDVAETTEIAETSTDTEINETTEIDDASAVTDTSESAGTAEIAKTDETTETIELDPTTVIETTQKTEAIDTPELAVDSTAVADAETAPIQAASIDNQAASEVISSEDDDVNSPVIEKLVEAKPLEFVAAEEHIEFVSTEVDKTTDTVAEASAIGSSTADSKEAQGSATPEETELLPVIVSPLTSDLALETVVPAAPVKPEKMSPVKSLASRFEGKREQSLDSLKFRTVREFFPEERSIRVGAEKKKYEALKEQQKLKAQAEEEAKSKYNHGAASQKSPVKETGTENVNETPAEVAAPVKAAADLTINLTEDATVNISSPQSPKRKEEKTDNVAEFGTPVKSIASRFEGKREQSLNSLKFRTVREFFPEERSIRVGSEKQKFESQAQQDQSLDKLKFRTVREFFPDQRSVHVGAEKAKFEALTKQQEEAAKAAEQIKAKQVPTPSPIIAEAAESISAVASDEGLTPANGVVPVRDAGKPETATKVEDVVDTTVIVADEASNVVGDALSDDKKVKSLDESAVVTEVEKATGIPSAETVVEAEKSPEADGKSTATDVAISETTATDVDTSAPAELSEQIGSISESTKEVVSTALDTDKPSDIIETEVLNAEERTAVTDIDVEVSSSGADISSQTTEPPTTGSATLAEVKDANKTATDSASMPAGSETFAVTENQTVNNGQVLKEGLAEISLDEPKEGKPKEKAKGSASTEPRPMLTTERSFVMEDDHTIETEDTVVVGERPMTDGEDEFEPASKTQRAHELYAGIPARNDSARLTPSKKSPAKASRSGKTSPAKLTRKMSNSSTGPAKLTRKMSNSSTGPAKLTRKMSSSSTGSAKSPTVPVPMKRASITAPTASYMARKAAEAEELHKKSSPAKHHTKSKGTVGPTGFFRSDPAAPTVPVPMKRASITAPTASYTAKKSAEEGAHQATPLRKRSSSSDVKGTVGQAGFVKPPPPAPTVPVPLKRASITAPTASWQARNVVEHVEEAAPTSKHRSSKPKGEMGPTGFFKPAPPPPTVPVAPKRASVMAPTASYRAKKAPEPTDDLPAPTSASIPVSRSSRYSNVKSKVLAGIESGSTPVVVRKTITKEEFILAERRKSLGSAGVSAVLSVVDRRASLTPGMSIEGPPEPFVRSAVSRKKLNSTVPRYMDYENSPAYAKRAQEQHDRRRRLEEENAAKSEKRQRELQMFFAEQQQKLSSSSADEVRRGLEAHEFAQLTKESEREAKKATRKESQRTRPTRSAQRALSATSSAHPSSHEAASRSSKKTSESSAEGKTVVETAPVEVEALKDTTVELAEQVTVDQQVSINETEAVFTEEEKVVEISQVEEEPVPSPVIDNDPELEHIAKKINFDEASSDSDEKEISLE